MNFKNLILAGVFTAIAAAPASAGGVNVGTLACSLGSSVGYLVASQREVTCAYHPVSGDDQYYTGTMSHLGLDVGYTAGGMMIWAVVAPGSLENGALASDYLGVSASATLGVGVGANLLVGGFNDAIALQPLSVQGQVGLGAALTATSLSLDVTDELPVDFE